MLTLKMRRRLIAMPLYYPPSRYERAQTKGCWDLRWTGPNSEVRIINPARKPAVLKV